MIDDEKVSPALRRELTISKEIAQERYEYNFETGMFTSRKTGQVVGTTNGRGYKSVVISGHKIWLHRLAFLMAYGVWPAHEVDHVNGDPSDNRIRNLRIATRQQNARNRKGTAASGYKGVYWDKKNYRWIVRFTTAKGVVKHIYSKGGRAFRSAIEAHKAYLIEERSHFGAFGSRGR